MAYCGPRGIPLSVFLGWDEDDQEAALTWRTYEARRCGSCGYHPEEGDRHPHINICPGCVALQRASKHEMARERGAQIVMVGGTPGQCARCLREAGLN